MVCIFIKIKRASIWAEEGDIRRKKWNKNGVLWNRDGMKVENEKENKPN